MKYSSFGSMELFLLIITFSPGYVRGDNDDSMESSDECQNDFLVYHRKNEQILRDLTLCFKIKPPETHDQKYIGCNGNEVDIGFYRDVYQPIDFQVDKWGETFWTDYVRHFEDGPIVDFGPHLFKRRVEISVINPNATHKCVTVNVISKLFTVTSCEQKYPRLCVVRSSRVKAYQQYIPQLDFKYLRTQSDKLIFSYTKPASQEDIKCFNNRFTKSMNITFPYSLEVALSPEGDDYYWCMCMDKWNFYSKPSEKILYLQNKEEYKNGYAIVIEHVDGLESWIFKNRMKNPRGGKIVFKGDVGANHDRTLLHYFGDLQYLVASLPQKSVIISTRNIFTCPTIDSIQESKLGTKETVNSLCKEYSCVGDFYYGSWWNITDLPYCQPSITLKEQAASVGKQLIADLNISINTTNLNTICAMMNRIISLEKGAFVTQNIIKNLESVVYNTLLPMNESYSKVIQPKLAVVIANSTEVDQVTGIKISNSPQFSPSSVHLLYSDSAMEVLENISLLVNVSSIVNNNANERFSFVVYGDGNIFNSSITSKNVLNSLIVSIQVENSVKFNTERYVDIHLQPNENVNEYEQKICAFWDFDLGSNGGWSTEGCELLSTPGPGGLDTCRCYHLTHFAQLISKNNRQISEKDYYVLTILSYIGCIHSLVGLLIIALTGILFESWRQDLVHKVWLNLSGAIGLMIITMFFVSLFNFHTKNIGICILSGVFLHYSVLSTFCWMFVVAMIYFQMTVNVLKAVTYSENVQLILANLVGWFIPLFPIVILFIANPESYSYNFVTNQHQYEFCYPSGLGWWLTVFFPVIAVVVCNFIIFVWIIYFVCSSTRSNNFDGNTGVSGVKTILILFFQFGLVWVFGLLSSNVVMAYLFCILGTMQGMVLCYFFVIGNKKTRNLWLTKLNINLGERVRNNESLFSKRSSSGNKTHNSSTPGNRTTQQSEIPLSRYGDDNFSE